jgi:5-methyltetrahydrofolate--homocysteine methyltransferase
MAEMRAIALAVRDNSRKPLFVTFTVNVNGRTQLSGTDILAGLVVMQSMGVDAFGMNCSMGAAETLQQLRRVSAYAHIPLIAKPNAGMPVVKGGKTTYNCTAEEFASYTAALAGCGVRFFGGCCGTDPQYIGALRGQLENLDFDSMLPPEKADAAVMLASEKDAFVLPREPEIKYVLCSDAMGDECDGFDGVLGLDISTPEQLEIFAENAYTLTRPVCLSGSDEEIYERALRLYQGRACYDGSGRLGSTFIAQMQKKYGLLVLGQ